jgi:hypothetical protein
MIYSQFVDKVSKYLKSVRILKNYVSFDMLLPESWSILKSPQVVEVIKTDDNRVISFVCENKTEYIDTLEKYLDGVVKVNVEKEEKERLFKTKVMELKNIFENEKLENLKGLKFDVEELTTLLEIQEKDDTEKSAEPKEPKSSNRKRVETTP